MSTNPYTSNPNDWARDHAPAVTCAHCGEVITEGMVNDRAVYVDAIGAMYCEDNDQLDQHEPAAS